MIKRAVILMFDSEKWVDFSIAAFCTAALVIMMGRVFGNSTIDPVSKSFHWESALSICWIPFIVIVISFFYEWYDEDVGCAALGIVRNLIVALIGGVLAWFLWWLAALIIGGYVLFLLLGFVQFFGIWDFW